MLRVSLIDGLRLACVPAALAALALGVSPASADDADSAKSDQAKSLFDQLDTNGDGTVTKAEIPEDRMRFFDRLLDNADANDDGQLSKSEYTSAVSETDGGGYGDRGNRGDGMRGDGVRGYGNRAGRRGDGRESMAPRGEGPDIDTIFAAVDANSDGKISVEEIPDEGRGQMLKGMMQRMGKESITKDELKQVMARREGGEGMRGPGGPGMRGPGDEGGMRGEGRPGGGPGMRGGDRGEFFRSLDANNDGKLTKDELPEQMKGRMGAFLDRMGGELDIDRMLAQRGPGGPGAGGPPEGRGPRGDRGPREGGPREGGPGAGGPPEGRGPGGPGMRGPGGEGGPRGDGPPGGGRGFGGPGGGFGNFPPPPIIAVLDGNDDGQLSKDEVTKLAEKFDELDTNKDGNLDRMELMMSAEMRERFGGRFGGGGRGFGGPPGGPGGERGGFGGPGRGGPRGNGDGDRGGRPQRPASE